MSDPAEDPENESVKELFYILLLCILFLKFIVEAYFEKIDPSFGHNTGIVVVVGILCSWGVFAKAKADGSDHEMELLQFEPGLFFDVLLPAIVFPSGFNMRRKKFFRNLATIMKFGFIGTLICFAIYSAALYGVDQTGWLTKVEHSSGEKVQI